jgi:hypothetical protein
MKPRPERRNRKIAKAETLKAETGRPEFFGHKKRKNAQKAERSDRSILQKGTKENEETGKSRKRKLGNSIHLTEGNEGNGGEDRLGLGALR